MSSEFKAIRFGHVPQSFKIIFKFLNKTTEINITSYSNVIRQNINLGDLADKTEVVAEFYDTNGAKLAEGKATFVKGSDLVFNFGPAKQSLALIKDPLTVFKNTNCFSIQQLQVVHSDMNEFRKSQVTVQIGEVERSFKFPYPCPTQTIDSPTSEVMKVTCLSNNEVVELNLSTLKWMQNKLKFGQNFGAFNINFTIEKWDKQNYIVCTEKLHNPDYYDASEVIRKIQDSTNVTDATNLWKDAQKAAVVAKNKWAKTQK